MRFREIPLLAILAAAGCHKSTIHLEAGKPGVALEPGNTLQAALPIVNPGNVTAMNVRVQDITLNGATRTAPTTLPVSLGDIGEDGSATVFATFTGASLAPGTSPAMKVSGTYAENGHDFPFAVEKPLPIPQTSPGQAESGGATSSANTANGIRFPHADPNFPKETNEDNTWPVPVGAVRALGPPPQESAIQPAPQGDPPGINFFANRKVNINQSTVAEPSGAVGGGVIFLTANWYAAFSTNGGSSFTQLDPTTIFPNSVDGGFCCDQIVQYAPSIDRILWLMQYSQSGGKGESRYRLAAASPATIKSSSGTSWTYWDFTSTQIGFANEFVDYPDMSVGTSNAYFSFDLVNAGGRVIIRIPLSEVQSASTINFRYTHNTDSPMAYGGHLSQNTADEIFWAGHNSNSSMRIFSWQESSNTYFWRDVNVGSWPNNNNNLTSKSPDNQDWLTKLRSFPGNAILGSTRVTSVAGARQGVNQVWFAWSAPSGNNFKQPHVQWIAVDRSNNFNVVSQQQIWNSSYAFAYPAFSSNSQGEVGMSLEFGGGGNYQNHVVGFWGDFVVYITTASNTGSTRFGDYVTIRRDAANPARLDAFGYGMLKATPPATGTVTDTRYIQFGR